MKQSFSQFLSEQENDFAKIVDRVKKCKFIPESPTYRGVSGPQIRRNSAMVEEIPRNMSDGVGRKPRDSSIVFNNFFNIMMEIGSKTAPHFRREIINTIDTIRKR